MSPTRQRRAAWTLLGACLGLTCGCGDAPPATPPVAGRAYDLEGRPLRTLAAIHGWNVVVVAYENPPDSGAEPPPAGTAATQTVCASPTPWPSAASLVSGLLPSAHGVEADGAVPAGLARGWTTAAEVLHNAFGFETLALRAGGWPAATLPLLQGFATHLDAGPALAVLEAWCMARTSDAPFFVYLQLTGPEARAARLIELLRRAGGTRPLLWAVTHLRGAEVPLEADFAAAFDERALLVPLHLGHSGLPGAPQAPARGVSQRHLLAYLLEQLGAPPLPGLHGESWTAGPSAAAVFEWTGSAAGTGGARTRLLRGARDEHYTYAVAWDSKEGTLTEHLLDRQAAGGPTELVGAGGRLPDLDLGPSLCAAIELVRDLTWASVDDMNWRIRSGYVADRRVVPGERPPAACAAARGAPAAAPGTR